MEEAQSRPDGASRRAIDQQREFVVRVLSRTCPDPTHANAEPALSGRYRCAGTYNHMLSADVHVVDEMAGLHIQAVAGGRIAVGYDDAFAPVCDENIGLDPIAATADVRRDFRRKVAHSGMEYIALAGTVETTRIRNEALTEAVIKGQHIVLLRFLPPEFHQYGELFGVR